ncbi:MAG: serine/threonine protein kinase, partial [Gemmatimonadetes bacterium]|nr:serine/threonine protein kinase [Gemmatimonadota bacterium]
MSVEIIERLTAALAGRYAIEREVGEGGMATVYLAHDAKHDRHVAVKVLRPELAAMVGAERFLTEIKTTANLQHPHILPLFDSGEADGFLFYVMPYVDGETLRTRIEREKQLSVDDALAITRRVAGALDYAHGNGVVHRDIKPANILLSAQGEPLVADFGIALAVAQAGAGRITETGLSLGTPHYMSPEQATGDRDVDPRSDVYALGCVLYEMLAGQPPFSASTAQATLVQILTADVASVTSMRRTVPPHIDAALNRALEKLPADRFASAADFSKALGDPGFTYAARPSKVTAAATRAVEAPAAAPSRPWLRDPRSIAALVALLLVGAFGLLRPTAEPMAGVPTRAEVTGLEIPRGIGGWRLAISSAGDWIAAGAVEEGVPYLFVRPAGDPAWRRLLNTDNASNPAFSPDAQSVAFQAGGAILTVPLTGGPAFPVASPGGNPHWTA